MRHLNIYDTIYIRGKQYQVVKLDGNTTRCSSCPFNDVGKDVCNAYMNYLIGGKYSPSFQCRYLLGGGRLKLVSNISKWKSLLNKEE